MREQEHYTLFSIAADGEGYTHDEARDVAKKVAWRKVCDAMVANYHPKVLTYRGLKVILWHDTQRCWSGWLQADSYIVPLGEGEDAALVERWARLRLAKAAWNGVEQEASIILKRANASVFALWAQEQQRPTW